MKAFITLAEARTPQGAVMTLHAHDGNFFLRVNRQPLMGTNASSSEMRLAELACHRLGRGRKSRVLIGGLGFGFSLRRVLEIVSKDSIVHIAELLPEVVQWNREFLREVNGKLIDDPRVQISIKDVFHVIAEAPKAHYDAILLDVDNGPVAMVKDGNARLYEEPGFAEITRVLKPQGRVTFWSASQDAAFAKRLVKAGFKVEAIGAKAYGQARRNSHTIFVADPRSEKSENPRLVRRSGSLSR